MKGFTNRDQLLSEMRNGQNLDWDIIIIGGGITGAGVLREARREARVPLAVHGVGEGRVHAGRRRRDAEAAAAPVRLDGARRAA